MDTRNKIIMVVGSVALIGTTGVGGAILFALPDPVSNKTSPFTTTTPAAPSNSSSNPGTATSTYKDGSYSASSNYNVPGGDQNTISAIVTVTNGNISNVKTTGKYYSGESAMYVDSFNSSISSDAVGQPIGNYSPSRVGGASLTTGGFNNVLDTIRSQATA